MALIPLQAQPSDGWRTLDGEEGAPLLSPLVATRLPAPSHLVITPQAIPSTASLINHFPGFFFFFFHGGRDFDHIRLGNGRYASDVPRGGVRGVSTAGFARW